jgi:hypothetical protein
VVVRRVEELTSAVGRNRDELKQLKAAPPAPVRAVEPEQMNRLRGELSTLARRVDELTSAFGRNRDELERLKAAEPARPARPAVPQRMVDQVPNGHDRGDRAAAARPSNGRDDGPMRTPAAVAPAPDPVVAPPAPADPEQVDLAVPLDQALLRPVRPWPGD